MLFARHQHAKFLTSPLLPNNDRSQLLSFLDEVSLLRLVNLGAIDRSSKEALCFFSNVYHTLLLHARTVLRLPSKSVR